MYHKLIIVPNIQIYLRFDFRKREIFSGRRKMAPKVKLVYFSVQGKGEIIRLVLHAGKVRRNVPVHFLGTGI
jgi:hypothetical protein